MSDLFGHVGFGQLLALVWLGFSLFLALALSWSFPRVLLPYLKRLSAERRSQWLWIICGAPVFFGLLLVSLCLLPSALSLVWPQLDHCLAHGNHHAHLCLVHGVGEPLRVMWLLPLVLALVVILRHLTPWVQRHLRASKLLASLERTAVFDAQTGLYLLDVDTPAAFVGGITTGRIFMSRNLYDQLSEQERALVLAHERAHVQRRDNFRRATAALLSVFHLPSTRRLLLSELELSCEQASDVLAAPSELERLLLARTLIRLSRIMHDVPPLVPVASRANGHLEPRIHALLNPAHEETPSTLQTRLWPVVVFSLICVLTEPLHHTTETILGLLLN